LKTEEKLHRNEYLFLLIINGNNYETIVFLLTLIENSNDM